MVVQSKWSWLPTILLLGFYVDVSERTIISAGTLRLRLSGLKSRAHLIRKYSFPVLSSTEFVARTISVFRQIPAAIDLCGQGQPLFPRDLRIFLFFCFSIFQF